MKVHLVIRDCDIFNVRLWYFLSSQKNFFFVIRCSLNICVRLCDEWKVNICVRPCNEWKVNICVRPCDEGRAIFVWDSVTNEPPHQRGNILFMREHFPWESVWQWTTNRRYFPFPLSPASRMPRRFYQQQYKSSSQVVLKGRNGTVNVTNPKEWRPQVDVSSSFLPFNNMNSDESLTSPTNRSWTYKSPPSLTGKLLGIPSVTQGNLLPRGLEMPDSRSPVSKKAEEKEKEEKDYDFNDDALADLQAKNKRRIILVRHVVFAIVQAYQTSIPTYIACWS